jgi:two-component system OmpR family response regulator
MKVLTFFTRRDLERRIERALSSTQYVVEKAVSEHECLSLTRFIRYEGILVDSDSYNPGSLVLLVKLLRNENSSVALYVLGRYFDLEQRLHLFSAGVDDCISDPFYASELSIRLGLAIRLRQAGATNAVTKKGTVLRAGDLELDLIRRRVMRFGKVIDLRTREFCLLEYLMRNANRAVTRPMILEHVWKTSCASVTNVVDVHISSLRGKLGRQDSHKIIQTNRGSGYTLTCAGPQTAKPQSRSASPILEEIAPAEGPSEASCPRRMEYQK